MNFAYKKLHSVDGMENSAVMRLDGACIPPDPANTDYAQFKLDLSEGAELLDAEGNTMSAEQVDAFVNTLP